MIEHSDVISLINKEVNSYGWILRFERIKKFAYFHGYSLENGELTPTLKVIRKTVIVNFAEYVDNIYADEIAKMKSLLADRSKFLTTYKESGADIKTGDEVVKRIGGLVKNTFTSNTLTDIGGFGGCYQFPKMITIHLYYFKC